MRAEPDGDVDAPVRAEPLGYDPSVPIRVAVGADDLDTDADGHADSAVLADGPDLVLHTDFDGDGLADRVLRLGPTTLPAHPVRPSTVEPPGEVHWWAPWTWFADP
ncbi:hypothetical protein GCM10010472_28640 [Pseudonocardia halophobica]|uniref:Uncharacterized protein n=1 Tax=Pseudonocardia halophobica TaxID=29401 RepID=A0A9W6KXH0_9PSEU|nr:hypothetical protein [Pseudonocardia halophobica]GLL09123.1 hypothetical protein GCM10017577_02630 [Pseudonocardia halophobica]